MAGSGLTRFVVVMAALGTAPQAVLARVVAARGHVLRLASDRAWEVAQQDVVAVVLAAVGEVAQVDVVELAVAHAHLPAAAHVLLVVRVTAKGLDRNKGGGI